jgi:hypothetical protein
MIDPPAQELLLRVQESASGEEGTEEVIWASDMAARVDICTQGVQRCTDLMVR